MKVYKILCYVTFVAVLSSCTKDGATGPQGVQGINGATGPTGANGSNGTSNISSVIFTITPGQWSTIGAGAEYEYGYPDFAITNADSDLVEVFYQNAIHPNTYRALPCTSVLSLNDQFLYEYADNVVDFFYEYTSAPAVNMVVKVVLIPPAIIKQHPNTNWKDYSQIETILKLFSKPMTSQNGELVGSGKLVIE
jgi:hypothetical protein